MKKKLLEGILAALFAAAFFIHAYPFWHIGTEGIDSVCYQRIALEWLQGNWVLTCPKSEFANFDPAYFDPAYFRPAYYAASALLYKIFGVHDSTLKILNLISLVAICWLLALTARLMKLRFPFSWFPGLFFALLPSVMVQSRTEMPHIFSAALTILSLYFFLRFCEKKTHYSWFFQDSPCTPPWHVMKTWHFWLRDLSFC